MFRTRHPLHTAALWLALSGVLLRSLIPVGFMPGWVGATAGEASWLVICPASQLHAALGPSSTDDSNHGHQHGLFKPQPKDLSAAEEAAMSPVELAQWAGMGGLSHCPDKAEPGAAEHASDHAWQVSPSAHEANGDAVADASQHGNHRIAADHQSCPFAAGAAPALPASDAAAWVAAAGSNSRPATLRPSFIVTTARRLPPARAPPVSSLV